MSLLLTTSFSLLIPLASSIAQKEHGSTYFNHNILGHSEGKSGFVHDAKYSIHDYNAQILTVIIIIFVSLSSLLVSLCWIKMNKK